MVMADGSTPPINLLKAMTDVIAHRGPDGEGQIAVPGCGLGHRRLAIIDPTGGAQPMVDEHDAGWISFNGEIYNFLELRAGLEAKGHRFRTRSDTEVLLRLIDEKGAAAMPDLRGMFALASWNARSRELVLARDRMGKKPLYWFEDPRGLYFASEIKALLVLPQCPRTIDPQALDLYLAFEAIPGTRTIFSGVHRLAPASTLTWSPGRPVKISRYWSADWRHKTDLSYEDAKRRLRELILDATRARLIADVPVGAFLSGGVDSSIVVAAMAECSTSPVRTFSIGFPRKEFNETEFARTVARKFGTRHEEFVVEPNAVELLPRLAWHYDQPFADSSALPTYYVSRLTRQHVTVALTGDGGDEFFGGYERYRALLVHAVYRSLTTPGLRRLAERATRRIPDGVRRESWLRSVRRFAETGLGSGDEFNLRLANHRAFEFDARRALYTEAFAGSLGDYQAEAYAWDLMRDSATQAGPDPVDRALRTDTLMYLPDTLMVKVDIASMAVSLETRAPLLDTAVMEFAASLPRAWKVTRTENKKILKEAYDGILPHDVLYRRKMGFSLPVAEWFRSDLYGYLRDHLLDARTVSRGYFRREEVERLIEDHRSTRRNNASRLWSLLMLEHWHREILERPQATV